MSGCEICGGELVLLGQLPGSLHYRCRRCGWDQTQPIDESDPEEDDE